MDIIVVTRLRNAEFISLGTDVVAIARKYDLSLPLLKPETDKLEDAFKPLNTLYAQEKGSQLSIAIELADIRRDDAVNGIRFVAEGYMKHYEDPKKTAASTILRAIGKYGSDIANQNYIQETATLNNLTEDMEAPGALRDALALLGLTAWGTELKEANKAFNDLYLQRIEQSSQKPEGNLKELRLPARTQYDLFNRKLDAMDIMVPTDPLTNLIKELNSLTAQYNRLLAGRGKGDDSTPPAPGDGGGGSPV